MYTPIPAIYGDLPLTFSGHPWDLTTRLNVEMQEHKKNMAIKKFEEYYKKLEENLQARPWDTQQDIKKQIETLKERQALRNEYLAQDSVSPFAVNVLGESNSEKVALESIISRLKEEEYKKSQEGLLKLWTDGVAAISRQGVSNIKQRISLHEDMLQKITLEEYQAPIQKMLQEDKNHLKLEEKEGYRKSQEGLFKLWTDGVAAISRQGVSNIKQRISLHEDMLQKITFDEYQAPIHKMLQEDKNHLKLEEDKLAFSNAVADLRTELKSKSTEYQLDIYDKFLNQWSGHPLENLREERENLLGRWEDNSWDNIRKSLSGSNFSEIRENINQYLKIKRLQKYRAQVQKELSAVSEKQDKHLYAQLYKVSLQIMSKNSIEVVLRSAEDYINNAEVDSSEKKMLNIVEAYAAQCKRLQNPSEKSKLTVEKIEIMARNDGTLDYVTCAPSVIVRLRTNNPSGSWISTKELEIDYWDRWIELRFDDPQFTWSWGQGLDLELKTTDYGETSYTFPTMDGPYPFDRLVKEIPLGADGSDKTVLLRLSLRGAHPGKLPTYGAR